MGKNWDSAKHWNTGEGKHGTFEGTGYTGKKRPAFYQNSNEDKMVFYNWCFDRAEKLFPIMKPGGYVAIFGHPKTNHRMKCAFEDAGFKVVEEIDWVYLTGMPKNQDIGKLFDKAAGAKREVIGDNPDRKGRSPEGFHDGWSRPWQEDVNSEAYKITAPSTDLAKQYDGWKTAGLKPAHEPITIFQKPLEGTYIQNIEKYGCGGMNIDVCRIEHNEPEKLTNRTPRTDDNIFSDETCGFKKETNHIASASQLGRFPANIILDEGAAELFDEQTGISKSTGGSGDKSKGALGKNLYGTYKNEELATNAGGLGDVGGGSRMFTVIKYCTKVSQSERKLPNGERNPHVTLKPVELIKWLIKLFTPQDGLTIDITAGSCTHGVACEQLNKNDNYNLRWVDIELMNTEDEPYCNVGKMRVESA